MYHSTRHYTNGATMNPDLLAYLPIIITMWTGMNLSWGLFVGLSINHIMQYSDVHHGGHRESDQTIHAAVWVCNAVLFLYLFLISGYMTQCADFILVFDVFVTSFLTYITFGIVKWYHVCAHVPAIRVGHMRMV